MKTPSEGLGTCLRHNGLWFGERILLQLFVKCGISNLFRAGSQPAYENPAFTKREPARCPRLRAAPPSGFFFCLHPLMGPQREATDTEPATGGVDARSRVSSAGNVCAATTRIPRAIELSGQAVYEGRDASPVAIPRTRAVSPAQFSRSRESSYGGLGRSKLPPTALTQVSTEELTNSGEQGDGAESQPCRKNRESLRIALNLGEQGSLSKAYDCSLSSSEGNQTWRQTHGHRADALRDQRGGGEEVSALGVQTERGGKASQDQAEEEKAGAAVWSEYLHEVAAYLSRHRENRIPVSTESEVAA